jgi:signal transduction histidine kinase
MQGKLTWRAMYASGAALAAYAAVSVLPKQFTGFKIVFGDVMQCLVMLAAACACGAVAVRSRGQQRAFWGLFTLGSGLWFAYQLHWSWWEVLQGIAPPTPSAGDVILFLHVIPLLAAAILQPQVEATASDPRQRLGYLDFALLGLWWIFVYAYAVYPWQYVMPTESIFNPRYNVVYTLENLSLVLALGVLWMRTSNEWKRIYKLLFLGSSIYAFSSIIINVAMDQKDYTTGGYYDLPLIAGVLFIFYAAVAAYEKQPAPEPAVIDVERQSFWHTRLAALAVLSMPLLIALTAMDSEQPQHVREFRLLITPAATLMLMAVLFLRQQLVDSRLIELLDASRRSYDNLQKLQSQLVQSEKLASIGRFVAGAAHEINNPLTAILGYSELLADHDDIHEEHRNMADKIREQARRTRSLVQNLITFAKQSPAQRAQLDINNVIGKALALRGADLKYKGIELRCELQQELPRIDGDENHLLQVCNHILQNAVDALEAKGGIISVRTELKEGEIALTFSDNGPGILDPEKIFDPFYTTKAPGKGTGLGLSACYGIIQEHRGRISCENIAEGGARFIIVLSPVQTKVAAVVSTA